MQFPPVCAWCGRRPPQSSREVKLRSSSSSRHRVRIDFSAPICAECETYAQKLDENNSKVRRAVILPSFILGFILSILLLMGDELVMVIILGPVAGLLIMSVAMVLLALTGLDKRWRKRGLGNPPSGYASDSSDPCGLYTSGMVRFYDEAYHAQFAALNPEWAWRPKS
ncbi:MAG: hypothetical protein ACLFTI_10195 [Anaerolineales bacterium]